VEELSAAASGGNDADAGAAATRFGSALRATLFQWREVFPKAHVYVLLDGNHPVGRDDPLHVDQVRQRPSERLLTPILRPDFASEPESLPQLLRLHAAGENGLVDDHLVELLVGCAWARRASVNGSYVAAWICSEFQADQLAQHLAAAGTHVGLTQGRRSYMPLFEPHRFALAVDMAPKLTALHRWLKPVLNWAWLDAAGEWRSTNLASLEAITGPKETTLSTALAAAQDRVLLARQTMLAMRRRQLLPQNRPEKFVDALLVQAREMGLRHAEDTILFALNSVGVGPAWHCHPAAKRAIHLCAADSDQRLADLLDALSDEELDAIGEAAADRGSAA
jgi:hypothetical protein